LEVTIETNAREFSIGLDGKRGGRERYGNRVRSGKNFGAGAFCCCMQGGNLYSSEAKLLVFGERERSL